MDMTKWNEKVTMIVSWLKENDAGVVYPVGGVYADLFYWHPVCCCPT